MNRRRAAIVTAGVAAGAFAGGVVGRSVLATRRRPPSETERLLAELPPDDIGPVTSFDGTDLAVRGAGPPSSPVLVFVHGFSLDMTSWHEQWTSLSEHFRCVLFDQRAHGRSGRPPTGDYSVSAMGRDLSTVLGTVEPGVPVVLVGHSMGAMAILAMAELHPDSFGRGVAGVVLVGASAANLLRGALWSAGARVQGLVWPRLPSVVGAARRIDVLRRHMGPGGRGIGHAIARLSNFGPDASPELVDYIARLSARAPVRVWTDGLASLVDTDLRRAAELVAVPSMIVVGGEDRVTPPAAALALAALMPDAGVEVVEGAGHMTMMERPERFNRVVADLASRVRDGAKRTARRPAGEPGGERA